MSFRYNFNNNVLYQVFVDTINITNVKQKVVIWMVYCCYKE